MTPTTRQRTAIVLLVVAIIAVLPGGLYPYYLAKLAVAAIAIFAAAISPASGRLPRGVVLSIVAGAVVLVIAALLSASPVSALLGRWPRYEGLIALPIYVGLLFAGARLLGPGASDAARALFTRGLSCASIAIAVLAVLEAAGLRPLAGAALERTGSFLGNATDAALAAAILLPIALGAFVARRHPLELVAAAAALVTLVLSASRAGLLSAGIGLLVFLVLLLLRSEHRSRTPILLTVGAAAVLGAASLLVPATADRLTGADALARSTVDNRWLAWSETLAMLTGRPFAGVGPSGFVEAILPFQSREWASAVGFESTIDSPHNVVLQAASAGGAPLVVVSAALAVFVVLALRRRFRGGSIEITATAAATAGVAIGLLTHFTTVSVLVVLLPLLGAAIAREAGPSPWSARGWIVGSLLLAIVVVPAAAAEIPLREARDAGFSGDVAALEGAASAVRMLRPWDSDALSIVAQSAAQGVESATDAAVAAALGEIAVDYGIEARERTGGSAAPTLAVVIGYTALGEYDLAISLLDELVTNSPSNASLLVRRGVLIAQSGRLEDARDDFALAAKLDPDNVDAANNLEIMNGLLP
jgi:O-antigen ligase